MQDPGGAKYLAFHRELLSASGAASKERALAAAANQGLDMERLERDMASDEVKATLVEARDLAVALGISGTPAYVVGDTVVFGAVGRAALKGKIEAARGRIQNEQAKGR
jgi:protein-disulfide isomerase